MESVRVFLQGHWKGEKPLLLGYSGGPDSKALLYALLEAGCRKLHIAHIDHGWREESRREAELLRLEAGRLGLPFHSTRLEPLEGGNREAKARAARLQYFRTLCEGHSFEALLLGHQADDWAETVLKRVFEGAHLSFLGGMEPVGEMAGIPIWRPLLRTPRSHILRFLEERTLAPLLDPTNGDPAYLRSRLRMDLFPYLTRVFGKEIRQNLTLLAERTSELKYYLDRKIAPHPILRGPWGAASDLSLLERVERRHFLQRMNSGWPRTLLEPMLDWLEQKAAGCSVSYLSQKMVADRGWIFALAPSLPSFGPPIAVQEGTFRSGDWEITVSRGEREPCRFEWTSIWKGEFSIQIPLVSPGFYTLKIPHRLSLKNCPKGPSKNNFIILDCAKAPGVERSQTGAVLTQYDPVCDRSTAGLSRSLRLRSYSWTGPKIPAFLRRNLPVFYRENDIAFDFLTRKALPEKGLVLKLILRIGIHPV